MALLLQIWGGAFYLSNKILFSLSESHDDKLKRKLKLSGWIVYILGVPAWVIVLIGHHDWIAASIEAGGLPAMILGLYNTYIGENCKNKIINRAVTLFTYGALVLGLSFSLYHNSGIVSLSQILEIGVMLGFLLGSYMIAKNNPIGWLFFMLMNISMALLMLIQGKNILMIQQLISLCFVSYGAITSLKKIN